MVYRIFQLIDNNYHAFELEELPIDWEQRLITHPHDYRHVQYKQHNDNTSTIIQDYYKDILVTDENPKNNTIKYLKHYEVADILQQSSKHPRYRIFKVRNQTTKSHRVFKYEKTTKAPIKSDGIAKITNNEYAAEYPQLKHDHGRFKDDWDVAYIRGHDHHKRKRGNTAGWKAHKYRHQWEHNLVNRQYPKLQKGNTKYVQKDA